MHMRRNCVSQGYTLPTLALSSNPQLFLWGTGWFVLRLCRSWRRLFTVGQLPHCDACTAAAAAAAGCFGCCPGAPLLCLFLCILIYLVTSLGSSVLSLSSVNPISCASTSALINAMTPGDRGTFLLPHPLHDVLVVLVHVFVPLLWQCGQPY